MDGQAPGREVAPAENWRRFVLPGLLLLALLGAGVAEGWLGRTDKGAVYGSDAVQYLDMARALHAGDWKLALNPLWGLGYPLLLAGMRPVFPGGPAGDLLAVRMLNLAIFVATGLSFWYLIQGLLPSAGEWSRSGRKRGLLLFGAVCIFAATQICIDRVSRVGPDQLVACLFFLTSALLVRMIRRGAWGLGVLCGLTLGFGYVTKQAFLPLGCFVLLEMCLVLRRKTIRLGQIAVCAVVFAGMVLLYASGLSSALGRPTLGEAGSINYAWDVNRLAKWVHWEGGTETAEQAWPKASIARFVQWKSHPPDFGKPIHPTEILGANPKIYAFAAPFAVTYPPYYNPPWFYEGYRHFWNWRYQVVSAGYNLLQLAQIVFAHPMFYAAAIVVLILAWGRKSVWKQWLMEQWPVWLLALATVALFLPVHLEGRYVAPALAVLTVLPFVGLMTRVPALSARQRTAILALFALGALLEIGISERYNIRRIVRHESSEEAVEWKAAGLLAQAGLQPDARIGMVSWEPNLHCDWAYMDQLHITGEIATAEDWKEFWELSPQSEQQVLQRFRETGATAVVAWYKPDSPAAPGWERMGDLPVWLYRLRP